VEEQRIRVTYAERAADPCYAESLAGRFQIQEREREVLGLLDRHGLIPLSGTRILEIGCGTGKWLRDLIAWGADPENVYGVELLPASVERARRLTAPAASIECGSAARLSFPDNSFDLVIQATVFSSVLETELRRKLATEMLRVLRPNGLVLWYDMLMRNPRNPNVRPVTKSEIRDLFPTCQHELKRVTLAPPVVRRLAPRSWLACYVLGTLPVLRTHYLGAFRKLGEAT
jgi:ubiquinone/menaquinone biosynthesis C-methylase UbiE